MFFVNIFHLYGFNECHSNRSCAHLHEDPSLHGWHYNRNSSERILVLVLAVVPIFGQAIGLLQIAVGIRALLSSNRIERINGASLLIRGMITFLGLGIICLLIDILITLFAYIKSCIKPISKNSNP